jgi:NADH:ubiquinone oxidoreductase subunit F (NADH-binding)
MTTLEAAPTVGPARLLGGSGREGRDLEAHIRRHGRLLPPDQPSEEWAEALVVEIEKSGLTGRGGAGFPTHQKWKAVRADSTRPVVLVNAMEGEPASGKDRFLVWSAPHLVLDGADLVAGAVGAERIVVCVPNDRERMSRTFSDAIGERTAAGMRDRPVEMARLAGRYIAGEESALVASVMGQPGLPRFRPDKSIPLKMGRRTAVVQNVETLAHVALIARYGADWFREVGTEEAPGTCLVTVSGAVERPGVVEVAIGTPVDRIIGWAGPTRPVQAALVGGYGGSWLSGEELSTRYAPGALAAVGGAMGAGVLVALPEEACGVRETERMARFMAAESAGQCGPCLFGLPAMADDLRAIADGRVDRRGIDRLERHCRAVDGRGACRHPDGVVRMVRSALRVFARDVDAHLGGRPCRGNGKPSVLVLAPVEAGRR